MAVDTAARALGISREKVTLHYTLLGGGFGRRGHRDDDYIVHAVLLSKAAKRPVKMMWTREDDVHNGRLRPITAHYLQAGLDSTGQIIAWHQRLAGDRVIPYVDPIRYKLAGEKDTILMLGVELRTYDIANQYCGLIYATPEYVRRRYVASVTPPTSSSLKRFSTRLRTSAASIRLS
jgi:isoquinoline 1-oxidoreductase beta subunit